MTEFKRKYVFCVSVLTDTWKQSFVLVTGTIHEAAVDLRSKQGSHTAIPNTAGIQWRLWKNGGLYKVASTFPK